MTTIHFVCVYCKKVVGVNRDHPSKKVMEVNDVCAKCMPKALKTS